MRRSVLVVAPYLPWPADFGGAIRIYELVRNLASQHDVILLAPAAPSEVWAVEHLGTICDVTAVPVGWTFRQPAGLSKRLTQAQSAITRSSFVELASNEPRLQAVMDRLFMTRRIDLVQYEFPQMTHFRPMRPVATVLDNHNIEHELLERVAQTSASLSQRIFNNTEQRKVRRLEQAAWRNVTLNVATSGRDAERIQRVTGEDVSLVPNGVDVSAYASASEDNRTLARVLFIGAMRHQPNAHAVAWYAKHVHPIVRAALPDATLQIVGADPPPAIVKLASRSIEVVGQVDSVVPYLTQAAVAIVPLQAGGGTRLKILEAFAAGVPVVSTTLGAEGLDGQPDTHMLLADSPSDFADAVIRVLRGVDLPTTLSTASAFELVRTRYDWQQAIAPRLIEAHDEAIERFETRGA